MIILDCRPFLAVGVSLFASVLISCSRRHPDVREAWSIIASFIKFGIILSMLPAVLEGNVYEWTLCQMTDTVFLTLRTDPAGMVFSVLASLLWVLINFYSIGYMRCNHEHEQTGYFAAFAICMSAVIGIAMASNLLTFFIFYELLTMASWPLVLHERNHEALVASRKYLAYTLVSGQLFLAGVIAIYCISGTIDFKPGGFLTADMGPHWLLQGIFVLMICAGSVKAAVIPLHGWLPAAMIAPTPVSALLHAVAVVKTGVFSVLRIIGFVFGPQLLSELRIIDFVAWAAAATIIMSSLIALRQDELKKRLAFSTVGQLSYIVLGAALMSPLSIKGAYLHLVAHAVMKITLFMCAGLIIVRTHIHNVSEMHGIAKHIPVTMACFTIASLGIAGTPFLVGFVSKWHLALGAVQSGRPLFVVIWVASALLAAGYLMPVVRMAYFRKDPEEHTRKFGEFSYCMLIPIVATTVIAIILGVVPDIYPHFADLADMASEAICHGWTGGGWH
ncbi:MAG: monovalent cation/H+ antiporter subunit D family protein [Phascolarctobacterium sp.]|nr:monovalent cation/H+ antiporter subunit D family protein [Phascolarctobacterium sp.]